MLPRAVHLVASRVSDVGCLVQGDRRAEEALESVLGQQVLYLNYVRELSWFTVITSIRNLDLSTNNAGDRPHPNILAPPVLFHQTKMHKDPCLRSMRETQPCREVRKVVEENTRATGSMSGMQREAERAFLSHQRQEQLPMVGLGGHDGVP